MNVVTITITDPELLAKLEAASGPIVFKGPDGRTVRMADPVPPGQLPAGFRRPPMSDEELERRRKSPVSGITLAEFFEKLERGEWR